MRHETFSVKELTVHKIKPGIFASHGRKNAEILVGSVAYNGTVVTLGKLPAGAIIDKVEVGIMTAFAGTSPTIDVGKSGSASAYMANTKVTAGTVGTYCNYPAATLSAETAIIATVGGTSLTAGAAVVIVLYHMS